MGEKIKEILRIDSDRVDVYFSLGLIVMVVLFSLFFLIYSVGIKGVILALGSLVAAFVIAIFSLLYTGKVVYHFFDWLAERIERE